ncbi:unnamed protein product [Prunus brigantina]
MALTAGKLTILVGAGILGSVLAKEGRVSDLVSGAFKIAWKQIIRNDQTPSVKKPHNDSLMAQMNNLRQELQIMASSRPVTIVTTSRTGTRYGIIIVVVVVGAGYIWWKGWKLPDMMFATRRSLSDACSSVGGQLESVYSSVAANISSHFQATKRALSSQMDGAERSLEESIEFNTRTQQEAIEVRERANAVCENIREFQHAVQTLETKINVIEGNQDVTANGVWKLCDYALNIEKGGTAERIQACTDYFIHTCQMASPSSFSGPVRELPPTSPSSSVTPLQPLKPALELPPFSSSRENRGILEAAEASNRGEVSNGFRALEGTNKAASSSRWFGFGFPTSNTSTILRTRSATSGMVQQKRSTSQQL